MLGAVTSLMIELAPGLRGVFDKSCSGRADTGSHYSHAVLVGANFL